MIDYYFLLSFRGFDRQVAPQFSHAQATQYSSISIQTNQNLSFLSSGAEAELDSCSRIFHQTAQSSPSPPASASPTHHNGVQETRAEP
jgi:hypothetical protein